MPRKRDLGFIIHGSRAEMPELRHLAQWVRDKGHTVRPRVTWEPGDGTALTRELLAQGVDTVVACGGDGTVNEVVNGLGGGEVPLGIIPVGTANDFARQVGIPIDVDHAMDVVLRRRPRRIDTAELNGRRFINVSTAGVGAEATAETPAPAKEALGPFAYAITGLRKFAELEAQRALFTAPHLSLDVRFLVFAVGNARATGGGTLITPEASVVDGALDVCIIEEMPRGDFARLLLRIKRGEHLGSEHVHYLRVPSLSVRAGEPIAVNVDGEPTEASSLDYRACRMDLRVYVKHLPGEDDGEQ